MKEQKSERAKERKSKEQKSKFPTLIFFPVKAPGLGALGTVDTCFTAIRHIQYERFNREHISVFLLFKIVDNYWEKYVTV